MEPREAARLPVPTPEAVERAWAVLRKERSTLENQLRNGRWTNVVARVDEVLLGETLRLPGAEGEMLREAVVSLRARRLIRTASPNDD
jgi:hypothetical protein